MATAQGGLCASSILGRSGSAPPPSPHKGSVRSDLASLQYPCRRLEPIAKLYLKFQESEELLICARLRFVRWHRDPYLFQLQQQQETKDHSARRTQCLVLIWSLVPLKISERNATARTKTMFLAQITASRGLTHGMSTVMVICGRMCCLSAVSEVSEAAKRLDATKRWLVALSPPNIWARAYKSIARQQRFRTNDDASVHQGLYDQLNSCTARRPTLDKKKRVRVITHTGCSDYPHQFQVHREVGKIRRSPRCLHHTHTCRCKCRNAGIQPSCTATTFT
jgi:hypothetical protein